MNIWHNVSPERIKPEDFLAVIEITRGDKKKYELDKETGCIILDRILYTSMQYPANYGFIPRTLADDGDPLDVLVLCNEPIDPLVLVECYPIGVLTMLDGGKNDEKIIAIPYKDPTYNAYKSIHELPSHIFDEMRHFFSVSFSCQRVFKKCLPQKIFIKRYGPVSAKASKCPLDQRSLCLKAILRLVGCSS